MKFCPNCKREINDNTTICPFCGDDTTGTVTLTPVPVPPPQPQPIPNDPQVPKPKAVPIPPDRPVPNIGGKK